MDFIKKIANRKESKVILPPLFLLFLGSLFLFLNQIGIRNGGKFISPGSAYLLFFILLASAIGIVFFFSEKLKMIGTVRSILIICFPSAFLLFWGISISRNFDISINWLSGSYWIFLGIYLITKTKTFQKSAGEEKPLEGWFKQQGSFAFFVIFLVMVLNLSFGIYHIDRFAAVDEPLWTFGRIGKFWKAIGDNNWGNTLISDKPGITVAITSGAGLLWENPDKYEPISWQGRFYQPPQNMEKLNFALRVPILLLTVLLLPLFYFLIERILGKKTALYSFILIGLAPMLVGISRIINPDSLLWTFAPLSILSYFAYLNRRNRKYLYLTGILLGFSILTKYVANILFIFFFGMIFLEYIFNKEHYRDLKISKFLKNSLIDFSIISFLALVVFYVFCPMAWIFPRQILDSTILSQAFEPVWLLFAMIIASIVIDIIFLKNRIYSWILKKISDKRKIIASTIFILFTASILFVLLNVYSGMKFFDFEEIFTSPKLSEKLPLLSIPTLKIFFADFYPAVFGIIPVALFSAIFLTLKKIWKPDKEDENRKIILFLISFILLYYFGSAVTKVASINRYQIIVFPMFLIISGIGISEFISYFKNKALIKSSFLILIAISAYSLYASFPFYISYASRLLPLRYSTDLKDMGSGSYEAAQFLNSLPNPELINIWTDKSGICYFFKGNCFSGFNKNELTNAEIQYVAVSSGRETRTGKMTKGKNKELVFLSEAYSEEDSIAYKLNINGRINHFIKIIKIN